MKTYMVNETFYALQGEGMRAGVPSVFIRFSGCDLACDMEPSDKSPGGWRCDTEFVSGRRMTAEEILTEALQLVGEDGLQLRSSWWNLISVIFTGGEPALQLTPGLVEQFNGAGFYTCIETNGAHDVSGLGLDWISCSPKVAEHAVRCMRASELRYVRGHGQGIPRPVCEAEHYLISPAFDGQSMDRRAVAWCVDLVKANPKWRLSLQTHKFLGIR